MEYFWWMESVPKHNTYLQSVSRDISGFVVALLEVSQLQDWSQGAKFSQTQLFSEKKKGEGGSLIIYVMRKSVKVNPLSPKTFSGQGPIKLSVGPGPDVHSGPYSK